MKPKLLRFVIDCSGSMYYFNGYDRRLERTLQTAVMIFEAFAGFEHKYRYSMVGHSGDTPCAPFVEYGLPPTNEKERLKVVQRMAAHTQFCMSVRVTLALSPPPNSRHSPRRPRRNPRCTPVRLRPHASRAATWPRAWLRVLA